MNERRLLIVMTAGFGDVRRWTKLGAALTAAIPQVSGTKALPLMHSANLGAFVLRTDCAKSPVEVGLALINALPGGLFEYGEGLSNPDRLLVAELGAEPWATDVVLKTAAGMR